MAIRAETGYLPGGIAFHDGLTGERQLDDLADLAGRPSVRRAALCDRLELDARTLRRPIRDYSRGMRQKLGIVQALQHDPGARASSTSRPRASTRSCSAAFYSILDDRPRGRPDGRCSRRTCCPRSSACAIAWPSCERAGSSPTRTSPTLLARRKRRVELQFEGEPPDLAAVPGVSAVAVDGSRLTCDLEGDPRPLLAAIASLAVTDLLIEPARLEDAFLELYAAGPA